MEYKIEHINRMNFDKMPEALKFQPKGKRAQGKSSKEWKNFIL
jgi:hypothetical protein